MSHSRTHAMSLPPFAAQFSKSPLGTVRDGVHASFPAHVHFSLGIDAMALQFTPVPTRPGAVLTGSVPGSAALGEVLLERNLITPEQLRIAIDHQRTTSRRIGQVLIDLGFTNAQLQAERAEHR